MIEIKIDAATIPGIDNCPVKFKTVDAVVRRGTWLKDGMQFWVSPEEWYEVWEVLEWELIEDAVISG